MKHYNEKILTLKEKQYSQLPTSVKSFCREQLQDSNLCILYNLQISIQSSSLISTQGMFWTSPQRTTLRLFFLQKINNPQTPYEYIAMIYNCLVSSKNPASFFKNIDNDTSIICNAAYERYNELQENSIDNILLPSGMR